VEPANRIHALDAVRAYALLLGVALHSAAAFIKGFPMPVWFDQQSTTATVIYYVVHMFRMSTFFLIAGFFARMVVERRGVKAFIKDRAKRIGIPLLALPIVAITLGIGLVLGALSHGVDFLQSLIGMQTSAEQLSVTAQDSGGGINISLLHMWFLYYLLIFYALTLSIRWLVHAVDKRRAIAVVCDRIVAFLMRGIWGPLLIGLPIALYFLRIDNWFEWIGLPAPFSLIPSSQAIFGYGIAFALGWLLHRQIDLILALRKSWFVYLIIAIILTVVCLRIVGVEPETWVGPTLDGNARILYAICYMTGLWCWVFALIGAAVCFLSKESPMTRYISDASYWIYLMHLGTVGFFMMLTRPFDWHWSIKFTIMIAGSMLILLVTYHYLVRFTWIGAILNGRRRQRPGKFSYADATSSVNNIERNL
jgi:glucans biosynthesis protein C